MSLEVCAGRLAGALIASGMGLGLLAGCGSPPGFAPQPSPEVTTSVAPSPTELSAAPSDSPSETTSPESTPDTGDGVPTDDGSERPPVLDENATGRDLTMSDFFSAPEEWQDGRFDVAGQRGLAGVSGPLSYCSADQDEHQTLELRLANRFDKLSMKIGQGDESEQSDAVLNVRLVGNGKYIDSVKVPFNKIDDFTAPVADVNALKIEVWVGGDNCRRGMAVVAVLSGLRLE